MTPRALTLAAALLLAGCAVGPDFQRPAPPTAGAYAAGQRTTTSGVADLPGGEVQHFVEGRDIPAEWWTVFRCKPLDDLVASALSANPDLKAAEAALNVARENVLIQRAAYFPAVAGSVAASRHRTPNLISPFVTQSSPEGSAYYGYYTPQVTVSYAPDVFGLTRRSVEGAKAQEGQARFQLAAAHVALSANVVGAAIQEASLRAQIETTRELIALNTRTLDIDRARYALGDISRMDVAAQELQLAQVAATLPPLLKQLAQQRHLLTALAGRFPSEDLAQQFDLSSLQLPQELPLSLPSQIVERRPDVRQAEENLHQASARIGVAMANRLPSLALTADMGRLTVTGLSGAGAFWDVGIAVTQVIFQGGALKHQEDAARAAYVQAAEQYRSTVLAAFQNVADALTALEQDADALKSLAAAANSAKALLELTDRQRVEGQASKLAVLNAEQAYRQAALALVQARAARYADTVALFQAVGGGWWNREGATAQ